MGKTISARTPLFFLPDPLTRVRVGEIDNAHTSGTSGLVSRDPARPTCHFIARPAVAMGRTLIHVRLSAVAMSLNYGYHVGQLQLPCQTTTVAMFAQLQLPSQVKVPNCHFLDNYRCCHVWSGLLQLP